MMNKEKIKLSKKTKDIREGYFIWKNIPDNLHIIITNKGYGKTFYERKLKELKGNKD